MFCVKLDSCFCTSGRLAFLAYSPSLPQRRGGRKTEGIFRGGEISGSPPSCTLLWKLSPTASDVWTLVSLRNACANRSKLILRCLIEGKHTSFFAQLVVQLPLQCSTECNCEKGIVLQSSWNQKCLPQQLSRAGAAGTFRSPCQNPDLLSSAKTATSPLTSSSLL